MTYARSSVTIRTMFAWWHVTTTLALEMSALCRELITIGVARSRMPKAPILMGIGSQISEAQMRGTMRE